MADAPCRIHPCGFPRQRQYANHSHALCHVVFGEKRQHGGGAPTANVSPLPSMKTMKKKDKETPVSEVVWEGVVQPLHWAQTHAVTWAATFNSEVFLLHCWLSPWLLWVQPCLRAFPSAPCLGVAPLSLSAPNVCSHTGEKVRGQLVGGRGTDSAGIDGDSPFAGESKARWHTYGPAPRLLLLKPTAPAMMSLYRINNSVTHRALNSTPFSVTRTVDKLFCMANFFIWCQLCVDIAFSNMEPIHPLTLNA